MCLRGRLPRPPRTRYARCRCTNVRAKLTNVGWPRVLNVALYRACTALRLYSATFRCSGLKSLCKMLWVDFLRLQNQPLSFTHLKELCNRSTEQPFFPLYSQVTSHAGSGRLMSSFLVLEALVEAAVWHVGCTFWHRVRLLEWLLTIPGGLNTFVIYCVSIC